MNRRTFCNLLKQFAISAVLTMPATDSSQAQETQAVAPAKIDPRTPLTELLPARPHGATKPPTWIDEDLGQVSEVMFGEPISPKLSAASARQQTAEAMAKINHLNQKERDGFMEALIAHRADLRGLPFRMGDDCRTDTERAKLFSSLVPDIRAAVAAATWTGVAKSTRLEYLWWEPTQTNRRAQLAARTGNARPGTRVDDYDRALVGAVMQILATEPASFRVGLAEFLTKLPSEDATRALARLAIFAPENSVRSAAIDGLSKRPAKEYTEILLQGLQYPLPAVAERSAYALVKLDRKELVANLIDVLDRIDPRLPVKKTAKNEDVFVVRELVRLNHNRNCLLCHSPADMPDLPEGVITAPVPVPGESLQPPQQYYMSAPRSPNIFVRIDMTYLRQDFSLMMSVPDAKPWPDRQRFDFLVRTRQLTPKQAAEFQEQAAKQTAGQISPYHRAAAAALRGLTGLNAETTARAWRQALTL